MWGGAAAVKVWRDAPAEALGSDTQSCDCWAGGGQTVSRKELPAALRGDKEPETGSDREHTLLSPCTRATARQ